MVLAGATPQVFALDDDELTVVRRLAKASALALAGAGASVELAEHWGALHLAGDPVTAATRLQLLGEAKSKLRTAIDIDAEHAGPVYSSIAMSHCTAF